MISTMFNTVAGKKIAVFGFAFKADTGDTRESPAIDVVRQLVEEHAQVVVTDPEALENAKLELFDCLDKLEMTEDPYEAASGSHAIAVCTEWQLYRQLDFKRIYDSMEKPAFIFDGRNILDRQKLYDIGFNVFTIGKPALKHF
jgi:UDPglucose 6-dehydrogenase